MDLVTIVLISIGLAMDAFAVSICKGLSMKKLDMKKALIIGLYFGFFQGMMPVLGYLLGKNFSDIVEVVDHWIAFILLGFIGGKMIKESLSKDDEGCTDDVSFKTMIVLAIATSIDALAVGITFAFLRNTYLVISFVLIGVITFVLSVLGVKIGNVFGDKYEKKAEFAGGLILILLGLKILLEHLGILVL